MADALPGAEDAPHERRRPAARRMADAPASRWLRGVGSFFENIKGTGGYRAKSAFLSRLSVALAEPWAPQV